MIARPTMFAALGLSFVTLSSSTALGKDGWIDLFNGKDLSGWTQKTGSAKYFVEDGCIVGETVVPGNSTNSFLCTTENYDNFVLELDFKVDPRMNSGVQFRSDYASETRKIEWNGKTITVPQGYVYGYQAEIDPDVPRKRMWTAGIYDERRRLWLFPSDGEKGQQGQAFSAQGLKIFKPNDWNHLELDATGPKIRTYLNGVLCATLEDSLTPSGFIGLQVHASNDASHNGAQVRFKNVRLKKTSPTQAGALPSNTLSEAEKKQGWRLLWDGKTTEGWRSPKSEEFPKTSWVIQDGELSVVASGNAESQAGGDIITRDRFSNFELLVDFKTSPGCNSGIKYFVQPNLDPITGTGAKSATGGSAIGLEFQILDDARHPDAKLGRDGNRTLGSLYDLKTASANKQPNAIGEWNTARIVAKGNHVEHWLNGAKILEYERRSPEFRKLVADSKFKSIPNFGEWPDGHILLQEHGSEVSFRNIKIRVSSMK